MRPHRDGELMLAEAAASAGTTFERGRTMLEVLRRVVPFDGAFLAFTDPPAHRYHLMVTADLDASAVEFLAGPQVFPSRDVIVEHALAAGIGSDRRKLERGVALNTRVRDDGSVVWSHHLAYPPTDAPALPDIATPWAGLTDTDVPVLLVRARHGYLPDDVVAEFRDRVPRATVVETETGHNVQEQDPAGLAAAIAAFAS